ncbi:MAG: hypothetical protein IT376_00500 [Polyangiaceae bacterium]|nr:hypothetical protein [Polyangiaceae bacterium]
MEPRSPLHPVADLEHALASLERLLAEQDAERACALASLAELGAARVIVDEHDLVALSEHCSRPGVAEPPTPAGDSPAVRC